MIFLAKLSNLFPASRSLVFKVLWWTNGTFIAANKLFTCVSPTLACNIPTKMSLALAWACEHNKILQINSSTICILNSFKIYCCKINIYLLSSGTQEKIKKSWKRNFYVPVAIMSKCMCVDLSDIAHKSIVFVQEFTNKTECDWCIVSLLLW